MRVRQAEMPPEIAFASIKQPQLRAMFATLQLPDITVL